MKTIIAGSRTLNNPLKIKALINQCPWKDDITEVVTGLATGPDTIGMTWAQNKGIPVKKFPAFWSEFGNRAGIVRNIKMGEYADALIIIWDGESKGSRHMKQYAEKIGLQIHEVIINE